MDFHLLVARGRRPRARSLARPIISIMAINRWTSAGRALVGRRFYRAGICKLPRLDKPASMDTSMGELFDAVWTKWTYRRAWLLVPFAYVASSVFSAS